MKQLLPIGKVSKLFGNEGGIYAHLYVPASNSINIREPLYVEIDMLMVPLFIVSLSRRGNKGAVIVFDDIDTPSRAEEFIGRELSILTVVAPPAPIKDEIYLEDFVGFRVAIQGTDITGVITSFSDNELNPLFFLDMDGKEIIVPAVDEFIFNFDVEKKEVCFNLPEGLLDL